MSSDRCVDKLKEKLKLKLLFSAEIEAKMHFTVFLIDSGPNLDILQIN